MGPIAPPGFELGPFNPEKCTRTVKLDRDMAVRTPPPRGEALQPVGFHVGCIG